METIKDVWFAVIDTVADKIIGVFPRKEDAEEEQRHQAYETKIERVQVIITRIKT